MVNQRDDSDLMKQRERPKPRRKGKYRDVSNPSTSSHMNQGPSHETKKYTPKARKSDLQEEEVESLPPIPSKSAPYREEKPARSGPPGFNQPKRNDPVPTMHQHEPTVSERHEENDRMEAPNSAQNQKMQVDNSKPPPEPVHNENRGWSRVIDTAPVQRVQVKVPQRSPPKDGMAPIQKNDRKGPAPQQPRPNQRKPDSRKQQPLKSPQTSAPPGGSWINRVTQSKHQRKVGTKAQSTTKLSSKNQWRALRKDASGEWDLTLYLPEIPVPNGWKALTHPLLKDHGELHKKLMSECGCKISIEGLKNENDEFVGPPGIINLHSDVGEEQNIRTAASRLLDMFNEILVQYNLPKTSIALLSNLRNQKAAHKNLPSMKPTHASKPPPHIKPNYIKTLQKPRELPPKPREPQGNAYFVKPAPGAESHLYGRRCRYCFGLEDCGDEETCWFRPFPN